MHLKVCKNCMYGLGSRNYPDMVGCGYGLNWEPPQGKSPDAPCNQWEFYDWELLHGLFGEVENAEMSAACRGECGGLVPWEDVKKKLGMD